MNFLVIGINYWPEKTGIGKYTGEMCEWLSEQGHNVNVITSMPYYPEWKIHSNYRNCFFRRELVNGVRIHRSWIYTPKSLTGITRIIHEFSFLFTSFYFLFRFLFKKNDIVVLISPPFYYSLLSYFYSRKHNIVVNHIQDLQIDAAQNLGLLTEKKFLQILKFSEAIGLRNCDIVSTLSEGMRQKIVQKGISKNVIRLFPNWVDVHFFKLNYATYNFRDKWNFQEEDFLVLYSGNIGDKQGLEVLLPVAKEMSEIDKSIKFIIVGDGVNKKDLIKQSEEYKIDNMFFFPFTTIS
jgi:colanic acid biosynthesis glycosyl transferase WcaI